MEVNIYADSIVSDQETARVSGVLKIKKEDGGLMAEYGKRKCVFYEDSEF